MDDTAADGWVAASLARLDEANAPPWTDATSERTETMSTWGTVNDYKTGFMIREATAAEWRRTADKENSTDSDAYTGAWLDPEEDDRAVYVSGGPESHVSDDDIIALHDEAVNAGDAEQVRLCDVAMAPRATAGPDVAQARGECVRAILDTRMEAAGDAEISEEQ